MSSSVKNPGSFIGVLTTAEILSLPVESRKPGNFVYDVTANELRTYTAPGPEAYPSVLMASGSGEWFRPPVITTAQRNAMIIGWGVADAGKMWFNSTTLQWEGWSGSGVVIIG